MSALRTDLWGDGVTYFWSYRDFSLSLDAGARGPNRTAAFDSVTREMVRRKARRWAALARMPASHPWNWRGPYVLAPIPADPWRHPYVYRRDEDGGGEGYVLSSYGADHKPGGSGDSADVTVRR